MTHYIHEGQALSQGLSPVYTAPLYVVELSLNI